MTVSNLLIRGAWDTENVLLLNYFGTDVPLTVLNGLTLQDDGRIVNFDSGLRVQGGTITVTNSQMIQDGGYFSATNSQMNLANSVYNLTNGVFEASSVAIGYPVSARFNQYGGSVAIASLSMASFGAGSIYNGYSLYGGTLALPGGMNLVGESGGVSYLQTGGTNRTTQVTIEPDYGGYVGGFTLNGGLLADSGFQLMAGYETPISVEQNGGSHVITNKLVILGYATHAIADPAAYYLNGGALSAGVIELDANNGDSIFVQSNATTTAGTVYAHSQGYYSSFNTYVTLASGSLSCSNFTLADGHGSLNQSGGALAVSHLLDVGGFRDLGSGYTYYGTYTFTGGSLTASNINISGNWLIGDGSANRISNPGSFTLSHFLVISNAVEQLGHFILASNATINLAGSASRLSFANSSGQPWAGGATLVVANWNGNLSGGGAEQLKFGSNQSGLTPAQVAQIQFSNPAGMPAGTYPAIILATGEVVPNQRPALSMTRSSNNMVISWSGNYQLLSSTNVAGPYTVVNGATSPYTNSFSEPQRFFELRSP